MADKDKKDTDPNTVLIPREMTERRRFIAAERFVPPPMSPQEALEFKRFEILPAAAISEEERPKHTGENEEKNENKDTERKEKKPDASRGAEDPSRARYKSGGVCPSCGRSGHSHKVTVTGDNYLHLYMEQQKQLQEEEKERKATDSAATQKRNEEKQREIMQIARAHELQDQLTYWEQQRNQGLYDENTINGQIAALTFELGSIPANYWK